MSRPRISCSKQIVKGEQMIKKPFVLPNPQISTNQNIQFLKKLSLVALSSISYIRNIFPEDAFNKRKLEGMTVSVIRNAEEYPGTSKMLEWIKSAFNVIEDKCLKKLILLIENPENDKVLETYSLNFTYDREAIHYSIVNETDGSNEVLSQSQAECPGDIKNAVSQLIRTIVIVVEGMAPLPHDCDVSMMLEFCEKLPETFEIPEHFKRIESPNIDFPPSVQKYKLGKVDAKFISVGFTAKSLLTHIAQVDEVASAIEENPECEEDEDDIQMPTPDDNPKASSLCVRSSRHITQNTLVDSSANPACLDDKSLSEQLTKHSDSVADVMTKARLSEEVLPETTIQNESTDLSHSMSNINLNDVDCICQSDDDKEDFLKCSICGKNQHTACYKLLEGEGVNQHVCIKCHREDHPCTVPEILLLDEKKNKMQAMLRRAIKLCSKMRRVSINTLVTFLPLTRKNAEQIFNHLDDNSCFEPATGKRSNVRLVNMENLDLFIAKHFNDVRRHHKDDSMDTEENPLFNKENSMSLTNKRSRMDDENSPDQRESRKRNKRPKVFAKTSSTL